MSKKKLDNRFKILIENGIKAGYRSLFVIVGEKSKDQVVCIHHILSRASLKQANVLWCYKDELALSSNRRKRMKQIEAKQLARSHDIKEENLFENFVSMTNIRYCYYKDTKKILGNTYKMLILQDFEALTPNLLCRTIETIEGGGVIIILLQTITSLKQLFTMSMDVHSRYRTDANKIIVPRFNERFILSIGSCQACVFMDDRLRILPISSHMRNLKPVSMSKDALSANQQIDIERQEKLEKLKSGSRDMQPLGKLIALCKTLDQANVVVNFITLITAKSSNKTVTLTADRGRGKSAAMGIALAGAIAFGYLNMYVTSPSPENLKTFFEFLILGLQNLNYLQNIDYKVFTSDEKEYKNCVIRIDVNREQQQVIQYISPSESNVLGQADLVVIDEAAAIPLPMVKSLLLGPYLVFLSSTISGYEGTGRSLSLKLISQLKASADNDSSSKKRDVVELTLNEAIRYKDNDHVEKWLFDFLCLRTSLEASDVKEESYNYNPSECKLYYVNRDVLFNYHMFSEMMLSSIMNLLVSSHYRNSPDDLQTLSDAPQHNLFILLPPSVEKRPNEVPKVLVVIQVCLEGKISKKAIDTYVNSGKQPLGDLIPWNVSSVFQDDSFAKMSGARIVRVATLPEIQSKGYGSQALKLLENYYSQTGVENSEFSSNRQEHTMNLVEDMEISLLEEKITPRANNSPLLLPLNLRPPELLQYMGVCYGASPPLLSFWKRLGYSCIYISQIENKLTGEHSTIMLKSLREEKKDRKSSWLYTFCLEYKKRLIHLMGASFRYFQSSYALDLITNVIYKRDKEAIPMTECLSDFDVKTLKKYINHQLDFSQILDIFSEISIQYFEKDLLLPGCKLKPLQKALLCGIGLQGKRPYDIAKELGLDNSIIMNNLYTLTSQIVKSWESISNQTEMDIT